MACQMRRISRGLMRRIIVSRTACQILARGWSQQLKHQDVLPREEWDDWQAAALHFDLPVAVVFLRSKRVQENHQNFVVRCPRQQHRSDNTSRRNRPYVLVDVVATAPRSEDRLYH